MLFFVVILINFNYIRKIIKSSLGATEGLVQHGFCVSGQIVRKETFEQEINVGAGRQFSVSNAHQRKAAERCAPYYKNPK